MVDEPGTNVFSSSSPSHKGPYDDGNAQFDLSKKPVRSMPLGHDALNAVGLTDTYYVYSYDGKLMAEYDHTGIAIKTYIYLGDRLLAEYNVESGAGKYYYYMSDTHRSTRLITDDSGTLVYSAAYDPFGNIQKTWTNTYNTKLKFSGKEREDYSGLDYFGARYYDSSTFRFNSVDPIRNRDEALVNPQLWNLYAYCRNNPISYFDPDGRATFKAKIKIKTVPFYGKELKGKAYGSTSIGSNPKDTLSVSIDDAGGKVIITATLLFTINILEPNSFAWISPDAILYGRTYRNIIQHELYHVRDVQNYVLQKIKLLEKKLRPGA